ncbi:MAG TPA: hypothetical protein VNO30_11525 [Kofleriaceae bacterium]|nr:hypothetical protein [Kofleriaceae bacterium]
MAKRRDRDNDATMDVSMSQLVPDAPQRPHVPSAAPQGRPAKAPNAQNDMSVWKQVVVGSDDFAPPPKTSSGRGRRLAILSAVLGVAAGGGVFAWKMLSSDPAPATPGTAAGAADPAKPAPAEATPPAQATAATTEAAAKPAEPAPAEPPAAAAEPAKQTWFQELASILPRKPTWFEELGASFAAALAPAPAKKPAATPGKRTAAVRAPAKKPAPATKKPSTTTTTTTTKRRP